MKHTHHHDIIQEKIIAHFYMDESLSNSDLAEIKTCDVCTSYYAQIKTLSESEIGTLPDEHYWDLYTERLEARLDDLENNNVISLFGKIKPHILVAAAVVILFIGFNLGKYLYQPVNTKDVISNIDAIEVENLVTRSKVLFTQFNQLDEFNARFFLETQQNQSNELLRMATFLRKKHEQNPLLESFIGDLEKVFLSMKSIDQDDIYTIKSIQAKLNSGRIIAKLDYLRSQEIE